MNKKVLLSIILSAFIAFSSIAQQIELTPYYGYTLNGKIRTYYGDYSVGNNPNFGAILSIELMENKFIELSYNRNETDFKYVRGPITYTSVDMGVEYYQIGSIQQIDINEKIKGFGGVSIGATRFIPKDSYDWDGDGIVTSLNDVWSFSATIGAGLKIYISDRVGIRLQARLLMPMQFEGLFIGIGSGGASGGASFSVPLIAGDFNAGLVLRLGK